MSEKGTLNLNSVSENVLFPLLYRTGSSHAVTSVDRVAGCLFFVYKDKALRFPQNDQTNGAGLLYEGAYLFHNS